MPQRVITEAYKVSATTPAVGLREGAILAKALADGWRITHTSSTTVPSLYCIYVTYVLERA